ncbi:MAG TPA: 4Fe-4S dicluster domain-containing protein [Dehalococcoidia bacterium]|nr:4Fe-4S dicluster domain-containing protein [Dehalococcoidia bacterium]
MTSEPESPTPAPQISRREFFKQAGVVAASVTFIGLGAPALLKGGAFPAMAEAGGVIMPDPSLCIGCLTCEVACSDVHQEIGLSDVPRIRIYNIDSVQVKPEVTRAFGDRGKFFQQVCLQCPDAPCVPVCPVDALKVEDSTGARVIDRDTCIACGKCEKSCIFPSLDEALATGREELHQRSRITYDEQLNVYAKCDLCYFREEGPACIEKCPVNIRINQKQIASDVLCLDLLEPVNEANFAKMRKQQTVDASRQKPGL